MSLTPEEINELAEKIAERVFGLQYAMVLTKSQAMALVSKKTDSAFGDWDKVFGPCACGHGRYSREKLQRGLKRESMRTRARKQKGA